MEKNEINVTLSDRDFKLVRFIKKRQHVGVTIHDIAKWLGLKSSRGARYVVATINKNQKIIGGKFCEDAGSKNTYFYFLNENVEIRYD